MTVPVLADAGPALAALDAAVSGTGRDRPAGRRGRTGGRCGGPRRRGAQPTTGARGVSAAAVFEALSAHLPENAVVAVDVGNHAYSFGALPGVEGPAGPDVGLPRVDRVRLPAAMGAWAAMPDRPVVAVTGDGGFGQYAMELTTAVKYGIPIKHVLLDNGALGKIEKEQVAADYPVWHTSLHNPDWAAYAELCGATASGSTRRDQLDDAMRAMFSYRRTCASVRAPGCCPAMKSGWTTERSPTPSGRGMNNRFAARRRLDATDDPRGAQPRLDRRQRGRGRAGRLGRGAARASTASRAVRHCGPGRSGSSPTSRGPAACASSASVPLSSLGTDGRTRTGSAGPTTSTRTTGRCSRSSGRRPRTPRSRPSARTLVATAIAALPERQQLVITLRDVHGFSSDEVCELMELTPANQRVLLHRARAAVRAAVLPSATRRWRPMTSDDAHEQTRCPAPSSSSS